MSQYEHVVGICEIAKAPKTTIFSPRALFVVVGNNI